MSRWTRRGMSLLIVVVAVVLLAFTMLPLFMTFQGSRLGAEKSINYLIAANLVTTQLEALRARPFKELEEYIFGYRGLQRPTIDTVNGPFETRPETPDIIEKGIFKTGEVSFDRYTFLAYFPQPNPSPNHPDHWLLRQRIRVRCDVLWKEPVTGGSARDVRVTVSTMVHNESFNPLPGQVATERR
ncbi:MAG: hypothetical protein HY815_20405 [Candidatus Riflebacteria bacterium]|nr:hypothetical protein [Candidatus Riflebacteria bacterium]